MLRSCHQTFLEKPLNMQSKDTVLLPLTKGHFAIIDASDFEKVAGWKWSALERPGRSPYAFRQQNDRSIYLHRFILDAPAGMDVDHIDGDGANCRRSNLRLATHAQNQRNYTKCKKPTSSRFKGVFKKRGIWAARIKHNRKTIFLGSFVVEEDAARAYDAAAKRLFGEFAKPNFPCV